MRCPGFRVSQTARLLLFSGLLLPLTSLAETSAEPSLDEALSGFEEEPRTPSLEDALGGFDDGEPLDPAMRDALEGFDDQSPEQQKATPSTGPSPHALNGSLGISAVYAFAHQAPPPSGTDYQGLDRLRTRLDLTYEYSLEDWRLHADGHTWYDLAYDLRNQDYPTSVTDDLQQETELGELWLRGRLSERFDLKLGRQIVIWGKSDNLRVTDVLNPLDQREPGLVDIEDLRLPVTMSRLDYYQGPWNLSALLIHEVRMDKLPPEGSEFDPFPGTLPPEQVPDDSLQHTQYALALNGVFSGWDLSLYAADLYDRNAYLSLDASGLPVRRHTRITMLGAAANLAMGNWLWKSELAQLRGLRLNNLAGRFDRSDLLLGLEYMGFTDASLSFELADRHLHDYDSSLNPLGPGTDTWQMALRYQKDILHDRLHLILLLTALDLTNGAAGFTRFNTEYELTDDLALSGGLVLYENGEKAPFTEIGDNDRVYTELKYSF